MRPAVAVSPSLLSRRAGRTSRSQSMNAAASGSQCVSQSAITTPSATTSPIHTSPRAARTTGRCIASAAAIGDSWAARWRSAKVS